MTFFDPITIDGDRYSDGGLLQNNPVNEAYAEALQMFPGRSIDILSLGTGIQKNEEFKPGLADVAKQLARLATETRITANNFERAREKDLRYFRFDPPDVGDIGLEEAARLPHVRRLTRKYIGEAEQSRKLRDCAQMLATPAGESLVVTDDIAARFAALQPPPVESPSPG